jgi:hypothetical protein
LIDQQTLALAMNAPLERMILQTRYPQDPEVDAFGFHFEVEDLLWPRDRMAGKSGEWKSQNARGGENPSQIFCALAAAPYRLAVVGVQENLDRAYAQWPGAIRQQALSTSAVAGSMNVYLDRAMTVARALPDENSPSYCKRRDVATWHAGERRNAARWAGDRLARLREATEHLHRARSKIEREVKTIERAIRNHCNQEGRGFRQPTLQEEIDAILAALQESGEAEAGFTFDCELEAGAAKVAIEPPDPGSLIPKVAITLSRGPAQVTVGNTGEAPIEASAGVGIGPNRTVSHTIGSDRRGVEYEAESEIPVPAPVKAGVAVKVWAEHGGAAPADFCAELSGKLGVGRTAAGSTVACNLLRGRAQVNLRIFAESYARAMPAH